MKKTGNNRIIIAAGCLFMVGLLRGAYAGLWLSTNFGITAAVAQQTEPTPTADPLAVPELPENPAQVDVGRVSFYYNCMPCHGDHGQGLTDQWRQTWVEDHQNCWARGCHGGRIEDEGFPLPAVIPLVIGSPTPLLRFSSPDSLHDYLQQTHPPQQPGVLPEEEYWALTAFLLVENGQLPPGTELGRATTTFTGFNPLRILMLTSAVVIGVLVIWIVRLRGTTLQRGKGKAGS